MAKGKRTGSGHKARYTSYKTQNRWKKNREAKLERALKRDPNNEQIKLALKDVVYRRKTPTNRMWSHSNRYTAQLFKKFFGYCSPDILSSNKDKLSAALMATHPRRQAKPAEGKVSFLLGARAHDKFGNLVWS